MIRNISEVTALSRKPHWCVECGRRIPKGVKYLRQTNADGADIWQFKAHVDCYELGQVVRTKFRLWDDWLPLYEVVQDGGYLEEYRGLFPHAVCRIEFTNRRYT